MNEEIDRWMDGWMTRWTDELNISVVMIPYTFDIIDGIMVFPSIITGSTAVF